ncbi:MAG: hypothetical protein GY868_17900, partial [Deltaproteobacteria bacterium]|nr:hypothetical protein [Deltaproteobacteria bacterium]
KMESLQDLNQSITVIDCKLEDVAFMLAGKLLRLDAFSSAKPSLSESLTGIILIVRNLQLSGFNHAECSALCGELRSYTQIDRDDDSLILLKVHAALERCRRLADQFCTLVLELFPQRVKRLGALLNIAPHTLTVYCESEIRKHLIFHLSNSADALLSSIRNYIPYSRLDIIIPGKASGIVAYGADLASVSGNPDSPTIAIIDHLTGDEDLPENISALICRKDTCHLSHFAVRARQAKIPFAVCRDQQKYDRLKSICGTSVTISICNENLSHQPVIKSENLQQPKNNIPAPQPVRAEPVNTITTINITDAQPGSCGSKAFAASRLAVIAQKHKNLFMTPGSLALPFGILQLLLKNDAQAFKLYKELIASVPLNSSTEFKNHLNGIQACISAVTLPKILIESIQENFGSAVGRMVRSSSRCEDLPAFSGAGLYCSKTNVQPEA